MNGQLVGWVLIAVAGYSGWVANRALRTGEMNSRGFGKVSRTRLAAMYWLNLTVAFACVPVMLGSGIYMLTGSR